MVFLQRFKDVTNREVFTTEIYWEGKGKGNLTSYVISTRKKKNKNIIVLATAEPPLGVMIDDEKQKTAIIKLYNFTKGGTDSINPKMGFYSVKRKSSQWNFVSLAYLLE